MEKLVSIITVTYNAQNYIRATLDSISEQSDQSFEFIVIDGASKDDTLKILNDHNIKPDVLISERDSGIYDAMMKGVSLASGRYVVFLNAGDVFYDCDTLKNVIRIIHNFNIYPAVVYGDCIVKSALFTKYITAKSVEKIWDGIPMCHQSTYVLRELFATYPLSTNFTYASDFNQLFDMFAAKEHFHNIPMPLSVVVAQGASDSNRYKVIYENFKIIRNHSNLKSYIYVLKTLPLLVVKTLIKCVVPQKLLVFLVR